MEIEGFDDGDAAPALIEEGVMATKTWAIEIGDDLYRKAVQTRDGICGFVSEREAVEAIISDMDRLIWLAKNTRRKAVARRAKLRGPALKGGA